MRDVLYEVQHDGDDDERSYYTSLVAARTFAGLFPHESHAIERVTSYKLPFGVTIMRRARVGYFPQMH